MGGGENSICPGPAIEGRCVDGHTECGPSNCACSGPAALDRLVLFLIHTRNSDTTKIIHTYIHATTEKGVGGAPRR